MSNWVGIQNVADGRFVSAWSDGTIKLQPHLKAWEKFKIAKYDDGTVSFKSGGQVLYLSANNDGTTNQMPHEQDWECFKCYDSSRSDGTFLLGTAHGTFLYVDYTNGSLCHKTDYLLQGDAAIFRLVLCATPAVTPPVGIATATHHQPTVFHYAADDDPYQYYDPQIRSCFGGDALVLLADGSKRKAVDIKIGESLATADGKVCVLIGRTFESHKNRPHECVGFNGLFITKHHPIRIDGCSDFIYPLTLIESKQGSLVSSFDGDLVNFVTEPRAAIVVEGVVVSTPGFFCHGIDDQTSFFGSEQIVNHLKMHPLWPDIVIDRELQ
jgi:hypothetical protein